MYTICTTPPVEEEGEGDPESCTDDIAADAARTKSVFNKLNLGNLESDSDDDQESPPDDSGLDKV